ncbi:hypothetical protein J7J41_02140 [bacterium]|nr:hypothetical protein [bacterium]
MIIFSFSYKTKNVILRNFSLRSKSKNSSQAGMLSVILIGFLVFSLFWVYVFLANKKPSLEIEIEQTQKSLREAKERQKNLKIELAKILSLPNLEKFATQNKFKFEEKPAYLNIAKSQKSINY